MYRMKQEMSVSKAGSWSLLRFCECKVTKTFWIKEWFRQKTLFKV